MNQYDIQIKQVEQKIKKLQAQKEYLENLKALQDSEEDKPLSDKADKN